jgi:hypothetical protein
MANIQTAEAFRSMAQSHRDMVASLDDPKTGLKARIDKVAQDGADGWKTFNRRAWFALGAIALSFLAAVFGMVGQSIEQRAAQAHVVQVVQQSAAQVQQTVKQQSAPVP